MIKFIKNDVAYYFERQEHLDAANDKNTSYSHLQFSQVAINTTTNTMKKCRYSFEDTFDKLLGV